MKKLIYVLSTLSVIFAIFFSDMDGSRVQANGLDGKSRSYLKEKQVLKTGGYEFNKYQIVKVDKEFIYAKPLNNISKDNMGLFLEVNDNTSVLSKGDEITVMFESISNDIIGLVN